MAEETLNTAAPESTTVAAEVAVVAEEATTAAVCEKDESLEEKISESASFKEESNVAGELPDPQKKALDDLKQMVQVALNKHEFTAPPPPPPVTEEIPAKEVTAGKDASTPATADPSEAVVETAEEEKATPLPVPETEKEVPILETEKEVTVPESEPEKEVPVAEPVPEKTEEAGQPATEEASATPPPPPEQGVDKEGHPVCYNAYGEYQNKELYNETFSTEERRTRFLRWRIQFLEKSIRKLDFSPDGICTIVQVIDFKNSPGPFKWELRQATNQALQLFQDNYPEFVAKQVFINVPFLYLAFYKLINPFFTQRTKSKFVFAGPSKTAETLFKYIAPELVPVQYGGLSREGDQEFTSSDLVTEEVIKPATKHTIEFPAPETCTLVWEARVVGYEMTYGAEFVPVSADSYTVIVQKSRKLATTDEPVICGQFKCDEPGKVVLTFDNQSSKKKKVVMYRSKTKVTEPIKC
ncbi:hypothetical protein L1987_48176 [Smallanthus sonchifolius]|uniref:Uncharacterized protein n=1 Tax=Smallanthus sonchifolius TaxID=185202 RepID=A0ACB9FRR0_9ASTR|nr:hypothetical protein L1987_48176 [Smallanthus sonchifolius]